MHQRFYYLSFLFIEKTRHQQTEVVQKNLLQFKRYITVYNKYSTEITIYNSYRQNIWNKVKKSSKILKEQKTLALPLHNF